MAAGVPTRILETTMRQVSAVVSVVAVVLMLFGFTSILLFDTTGSQAQVTLSPPDIIWIGRAGWGLWAMSAGIVLLALLPTVRVLLALVLFLRSRAFVDVGVAFVVLLELLFSMWAGR